MPEGSSVILIGGSAGSFSPVRTLLEHLPADLPAAVFIVIHTSDFGGSVLPEVLGKHANLPVAYASDSAPIELGRVYVAPPDRHMLVKTGEIRIIHGPRENRVRPSIDSLFRTAARTYGNQVVSVVMSGLLNDGMLGSVHVKENGGIVVVQDPEEAEQPSMPTAVLQRVGADHVLGVDEIASLLVRLANDEPRNGETPVPPAVDVSEGKYSALSLPGLQKPSSPFICPDCGGALWEHRDGENISYRCHVGHGFTGETLMTLQSVELEQVLWTAVRLFEEKAELQRRMARTSQNSLSKRFKESAVEFNEGGALIRQLLTGEGQESIDRAAEAVLRREYEAYVPSNQALWNRFLESEIGMKLIY